MNFYKKCFFLCFFLTHVCATQAWFHSGSITQKPTIENPETMNQNLTLNVNFCPTQIQNPVLLPDKFFSSLPFKQWSNRTVNFFNKNRYLLGASLLFGGYIVACNYTVQANKFLERTDTWASWHNEITAEQLMAINHKELAKELILEIQRRYSNPKNPTDFISPLIAFIQAIDKEILLLKKYITYYTWVQKLHLQGILPIQQKLLNKADDSYKKIMHVKNIFLSWAADYKINHNKTKPTHNQ
jgi:hypothetical protein